MKKALSVILSLIMLISITAAADFPSYANSQMTMTFGQTEARSIFDMINELRTDNPWYWNADDTTKTYPTLNKLQYDYDLEKIAMQRAVEIAVKYYPAHYRPNGERCFEAYNDAGYDYTSAGENIAWGQTSAEMVHEAWSEDSDDYSGQGHRRNMLSSKYTAVGIGHVEYNGVDYWVEEFASPSKNLTLTAANDNVVDVTVDNDYNVTYTDHTHIFTDVKTDATCTEDGYTTKICSLCGYSYKTDCTAKNEHSYVDTVIEPTCYSVGYTRHKCKNCDEYYDDTYTEKTAHTPVTLNRVEPTCSKTGLTEGTVCEVCGIILSEQEIIPKTAHTAASVPAVSPTCTETGRTEKVYCAVCGETITASQIIPATGHNFGDGEINCLTCGTRDPNIYRVMTISDGLSTSYLYYYNDGTIKEVTDDGGSVLSSSDDDTQENSSESTDNFSTAQASESSASSKPSIKKLKKGKKKITVQWKKSGGVSGYQIQVATDKKFKKNRKSVFVSKQGKTKATVKGLKSGKKYYVRIRTYDYEYDNSLRRIKYYSGWSKVKTIKTK